MPIPASPSQIDSVATVLQGFCVRRATQVPPASAAGYSLFQNTGPVLITGIWGIVTAAPDANAELLRLYIGVTGTTDICGLTTTIAAAVLGSVITCTGVFATVPVITLPSVPTSHVNFGKTPFLAEILWPYLASAPMPLGLQGTVASNLTISIQWNITYVPLAPGAVVAAV